MNRRIFLEKTLLLPSVLQLGIASCAGSTVTRKKTFKRIAIEEAFATPEILQEWRKFLSSGTEDEPGFRALIGSFLFTPAAKILRDRLIDIGDARIQEMNAAGIDIQLLSLTAPGVQIFDVTKAIDLARRSNDRLSEAVRVHPDRFAGLAAIAPQDPNAAARELERAVKALGLKGALINSHTKGEYLDEQKYWAIFEMAQALDVPIYLHPRTPPPQMLKPYLSYRLEGAGWGFAAEAGLHAMRLILGGIFDQFPRLKIILGHMGEGIPFWLSRIDNRFNAQAELDIPGRARKLRRAPSEYFKDNFLITTSGMNWNPASYSPIPC